MRFRWRAILSGCGLVLFAIGTYADVRKNQDLHHGPSRYFWWSAMRLDSDPLNRHSEAPAPLACINGTDGTGNRLATEPLGTWVDPGWLAKCFILTDLPAFLATKGIVRGLARLGVSEIPSFFVSMPLLTLAWFYFVGWLFDRWRSKRART